MNSENGKHFCGIKCSNEWLGTTRRGEKHPNWINGESVYRNLLSRAKQIKVCQICCEKDSRVLAVHHLDRNRENNDVTNLVWLCHNCHFLVHHNKVELAKFNKKISGN